MQTQVSDSKKNFKLFYERASFFMKLLEGGGLGPVFFFLTCCNSQDQMLDSSHTHLSISLELDSSHDPESSSIQAKLLLFCKYPFNPPQTSTLIITFRSTKTERKHSKLL
jgi:hypothetical protein